MGRCLTITISSFFPYPMGTAYHSVRGSSENPREPSASAWRDGRERRIAGRPVVTVRSPATATAATAGAASCRSS